MSRWSLGPPPLSRWKYVTYLTTLQTHSLDFLHVQGPQRSHFNNFGVAGQILMQHCTHIKPPQSFCLWANICRTNGRLQMVQNATARLLTRTRSRMTRITPVIYYLHWLPIRIPFKVLFKWPYITSYGELTISISSQYRVLLFFYYILFPWIIVCFCCFSLCFKEMLPFWSTLCYVTLYLHSSVSAGWTFV